MTQPPPTLGQCGLLSGCGRSTGPSSVATSGQTTDWLIEPIVATGARPPSTRPPKRANPSSLTISPPRRPPAARYSGYAPRDPLTVVYVDLEMTEADLRERPPTWVWA